MSDERNLHIATISKSLLSTAQGRPTDPATVINAGMTLLSSFLDNVQRIADAQEKTANLLEADASPQTLVKVEERRG